MTETKAIVFGLDGACFELVRPWLAAGRLPTLSGILDEGGSTRLESSVPATTPPAWTSLTTGVNPGKHGVFGFYSRERGSYKVSPVSDANVDRRRLWDYATEAGLTSVVLNVPVTHPPREIEGCLVPGYMAPDPPTTYPKSLLSDLGFDNYRVYAPAESRASASEAELLNQWLDLTKMRGDLAIAAADKYDPDLLFVEFQKTDAAVHRFSDKKRIARIYEEVDQAMSSVLNAVGGDPNVVVVSDHGIGAEKRWSVALNTWLAQRGYLETKAGEGDDRSWREENSDVNGRSTGRHVMDLIGSVGLTKQHVERALSALGFYDIVAKMAPPGLGDPLPEETVDRRNSVAFYENMGFSGVDLGVVINRMDFYPDGAVSMQEYESVRDELINELKALTGPDRERVFELVRRREEVYEGPAVDLAPDIVLEQGQDYVIGSYRPRGQVFIEQRNRIDHTRHGLLAAVGPEVVEGWSVEWTPSLENVTPTILAMLGVLLDVEFDGKPVASVLSSQPTQSVEYETFDPTREASNEKEETLLRNRLENLGYLE